MDRRGLHLDMRLLGEVADSDLVEGLPVAGDDDGFPVGYDVLRNGGEGFPGDIRPVLTPLLTAMDEVTGIDDVGQRGFF